MSKRNDRGLLVLAILALVYIAVVLLVPIPRSPIFWLAFACTLGMFALCGVMLFRYNASAGSLESKLLGWSIVKAAWTALTAQIAVGVAMMLLGPVLPAWVACVAEVLLFGAAAVLLITRQAGRDAVEAAEVKLKDDTAQMKRIRAKAAALQAQLKGSGAEAAMSRLSEALRYSSPVTSDSTVYMEAELEQLLRDIGIEQNPQSQARLIARASALLEQRNAAAKYDR